MPSLARAAAVLGAAASAGALIALVNGPWVRVADVAHAGTHHTEPAEVDAILGSARGASVLTVDTAELEERIEALPAVADAAVQATVPGRVRATVSEHKPAFVWQTRIGLYLGATDGTVFAFLPDDQALQEEIAALPRISDGRSRAWGISVGDAIPSDVLSMSLRILELDPAMMGSESTALTLRLDDSYGFRVASNEPEWEIALGTYGADPNETEAEAQARLDRQIAAVRTLFAERDEAEIAWVDVRNPGKVYFRAKG